ncbi:MAG: helix-turn-helix transcriptional regulator [Spirochaetes bacterium]|nr:helix-turn-helix transcriptional regulator [Spirochaetota bacterium]
MDSWTLFVQTPRLREDPDFSLLHLGRGDTYRGWVVPGLDPHGWFLLHAQSPLHVYREGLDFLLPAGHGMLLRYDRPLRYGAEGPWRRSYVRAGGRGLTARIGALTLKPFAAIPMEAERFDHGLAPLRRELLEEHAPDRAILRLGVEICLEELRRAQERGRVTEDGPGPLDEAERWLRGHYREGFTLAQLASLTGYAPPYFATRFREKYGSPPHEYATRLRLAEATELLGTGSSRIQEVAQRVGYENALYFSRVFRRYLGVSPRAWRRARSALGET